MRVLAILLFAAAAHAAIIKRDVSVIPAEAVKFIEITDKAPAQDKDNNAEKDPLAPQAPVGQVGNDLRVASELHIPVAIVQDTQYVVKTSADNEVTPPRVEETIRDEEEDVQTPKPGIIQQGIQNLQALQQAATLSFQNAIKPLQSDTPASSSGSNQFEQSIASLQGAFNNGINSINQAINNYVNPPAAAQSDEQPSNQNILENFQQNLQNNLNRLNQTIQNIIHPAQGSPATDAVDNEKKITQIEEDLAHLNQGFQTGLKSAAEGLDAISSFKGDQTEQSSNGTTGGTTGGLPGGFPGGNNPFASAFNSFLNNWGQNFTNGIQSFTTTFNNFFNPANSTQQSEEGSGSRPPIIIQGFQGIQQALQNFQNTFSGSGTQPQSDAEGSATRPPGFLNPIQAINNSWQSFTQNVQNAFSSNQNQNGQPGQTVPATAANPTKTVVDEEIPVTEDNGTKKGHGGGGSGDNNDVDSSSAGIAVKSDPEKLDKAPETPEAPAGVPAEAPEKSEEAAKPAETEKSVDA